MMSHSVLLRNILEKCRVYILYESLYFSEMVSWLYRKWTEKILLEYSLSVWEQQYVEIESHKWNMSTLVATQQSSFIGWTLLWLLEKTLKEILRETLSIEAV